MTDEEAVEETPAVDDTREQLLNELSQNLGDILVESHLRPHEDAVSYTHLTLPTTPYV